MTERQTSKLLGTLFARVNREQCLRVLHIGPALPETIDFFSQYRCRLQFLDLFEELPIEPDLEADISLRKRFADLLAFPVGTRFDLCLFWDLFNYLDDEALAAFQDALRPYLHRGTHGHGFAMHNLRAPQRPETYSILEVNTLCVRPRPARLPGYSPHPQSHLQGMLPCFSFERSVLLSDSRLEFLLGPVA